MYIILNRNQFKHDAYTYVPTSIHGMLVKFALQKYMSKSCA